MFDNIFWGKTLGDVDMFGYGSSKDRKGKHTPMIVKPTRGDYIRLTISVFVYFSPQIEFTRQITDGLRMEGQRGRRRERGRLRFRRITGGEGKRLD